MEKRVSVIVPVYRTERYLERCVKSILDQTCRSLEVILVDDGSPDGCPALCDSFAERDARVRVLHKKNGGLMAAWMDGVRMSVGDYLCFVDSDDWIETGMIERLMALASDSKREVICGNYVQDLEDVRGRVRKSIPVCQALSPGVYTKDALRERVHPHLAGEERRPITLSRCMKLFSRQLFMDNMHYCNPSVVMGEDSNITIPVLLDAERIVIAEGAYDYHYLYLEDSMVHRYDPGLADNIILLFHIIRQVLTDKKAPDALGQSGREYLLLLFLVLKNEARSGKKGWMTRARSICLLPETRQELKNHPLRPRETVNRILYKALRKPGGVRLTGLKLLLLFNDWRKR